MLIRIKGFFKYVFTNILSIYLYLCMYLRIFYCFLRDRVVRHSGIDRAVAKVMLSQVGGHSFPCLSGARTMGL